jgi:hypothetical protein
MAISTIGSNSLNQTSDLTINTLTVGLGGGSVASNTAFGLGALSANTSGSFNVAVGRYAMSSNLTGSNNTACGRQALSLSTAGDFNTAIGNLALYSNTTATGNTAVGYQSGYTQTVSNGNTFLGYRAGYVYNPSAGDHFNTFVGYSAGSGQTSGVYNTYVGLFAGNTITTGQKNTIIGGYNGNQGGLNITTTSNNVVLSDGDGNIKYAYESNSNTTKMPDVYTNTSGTAANVVILSSGTICRSTSSLKYKRDVQNATHGLAKVLQLRPVTYKGKSEKDGDTVFGGLIAEEVHDAGLTEFVQYAEDGLPDALNYGNMVSLAFKAIQELKTIVDAQAAEIAELKAKVA